MDLVTQYTSVIKRKPHSPHPPTDTHPTPSGHKCIFEMPWRPVFKNGLQDGCEDLKTLTDTSFWKRIFKVLKTSNLNVLQPKFNAPSKTSIQVALKTTSVGS